jgi:hypothetical protein
LFERTFDEGMALSKNARAISMDAAAPSRGRLPRKARSVYAGESMRVTTRLMQAASWLSDSARGCRTATCRRKTRHPIAIDLARAEICMGRREKASTRYPAN